jgi:hypothetical protein
VWVVMALKILVFKKFDAFETSSWKTESPIIHLLEKFCTTDFFSFFFTPPGFFPNKRMWSGFKSHIFNTFGENDCTAKRWLRIHRLGNL